jgi:sec-independent protein translocase protein TatA
MLPNVGGGELVIVQVLLLLLFGAKRVPELAKGLGAGIREFRKDASGEKDEVRERDKEGKPLQGESIHDSGLRSGSDKAMKENARAEQKS